MTSFSSADYLLSLSGALTVAYFLKETNFSKKITFGVIPFVTAYIILWLTGLILPGLNRQFDKKTKYIKNTFLGKINSLPYVQFYPPLLIVAVFIFGTLFYLSN